MNYYLDTSTLLKTYMEEDGSRFVLGLMKKKGSIFFASVITYAEIYSTLTRLYRDNHFSLNDYTRSKNLFEDDWSKLARVDFSAEVRSKIPTLYEKIYLKGADMIHLASAINLSEKNIDFHFVSADKKLLNAAKTCGLKTTDPTE